MFVGILKISLHFHEIYSLKEKRQRLNSLKAKIFSKYKLLISEIEDQDQYHSSILGLSFVSNSKDHCVQKIQKIVNFLDNFESDIYEDSNFSVEEF